MAVTNAEVLALAENIVGHNSDRKHVGVYPPIIVRHSETRVSLKIILVGKDNTRLAGKILSEELSWINSADVEPLWQAA